MLLLSTKNANNNNSGNNNSYNNSNHNSNNDSSLLHHGHHRVHLRVHHAGPFGSRTISYNPRTSPYSSMKPPHNQSKVLMIKGKAGREQDGEAAKGRARSGGHRDF